MQTSEEDGDRKHLRVLADEVGELRTLGALGVDGQCAPLPTMSCTRSSRSVLRISRSATLVPSYITAIRSQTRKRSCRRWVIRTTETPLALTRSMSVEDRLDLGHGERRGRLVHDQNLGIEGGGAGDRDGLALAAGELLDLGSQPRDADLERVEHLARLGEHASAVEERSLGEFAAEEQVADDVDVVAEAEVLEHHLDLAGARVRRAGEADLLPLDRDRSRVGE